MFVRPAPQLVQPGAFFHRPRPPDRRLRFRRAFVPPLFAVPRKFATAWRSLTDSAAACVFMMPLSNARNIAVGVMVLSTETGGIRAPGVGRRGFVTGRAVLFEELRRIRILCGAHERREQAT